MYSVRVSLFVVGIAGMLLPLCPLSRCEQAQGACTVVASPNGGLLNAAASISANDVWAVGKNHSKTLAEDRNGAS